MATQNELKKSAFGASGPVINEDGTIDNDTTFNDALTVVGAFAAPSVNIAGDGAVAHLKYGNATPTCTGVANVTGTPTATTLYTRVGDIVTVHFAVTVTPTADATLTQVGIALTIASNIGSLFGTASHQNGSTLVPGTVVGDTTNDRAELRFKSSGTGSHIFRGSFGYRVQ